MNTSAHDPIAEVVRDSYGRLVAYLASRAGDVAGAEDALSDAFAAALERCRPMAFLKSPKHGCYASRKTASLMPRVADRCITIRRRLSRMLPKKPRKPPRHTTSFQTND